MVQTRSRALSRPSLRKAKSISKPSSTTLAQETTSTSEKPKGFEEELIDDEQIEGRGSIGKNSVANTQRVEDKHVVTASKEPQTELFEVNFQTNEEDGLGDADNLQVAGIVESISLGVPNDAVFNEEDLEPESAELVSHDVLNDVVSKEEALESYDVSEDIVDDAVSDEDDLEPGYIEFGAEGPNKEKKVIHFNDKGQPIGEGSAPFTSELGSIMRKHCPISYETWRGVPGQIKDKLWKLVTDKYIVPVAYKQNVLEKIHNYWRSHKSLLRIKHYDRYDTNEERKRNCPKGVRQDIWNKFVDNQSSPVAQARRTAGKKARQAMKTPHVSGRTGAARMAEALKRGNPLATVTRTDLYLAMHSRKDGSCPTPELTEKVEKIKAIAKENPSSINLDVDHDPVAQVYGPERGGRSVRGMGVGVSKASLRHSAAAMDQLHEERRLRIAAEEQVADLRVKVVSPEPIEIHSTAACWFQNTPILRKRKFIPNLNNSVHELTSSSKKRRGFEDDDIESDYEEGPIAKKKVVQFNDKGQPIGEGSAPFTSELGYITRKHCPISYEKWRDVPNPTKDTIWKLITDKYIIPMAYKQNIIEKINNCWRNYKSKLLTTHYDRYDTDEERKRNRPKGVKQDVWDKFVDNQSSPAAQARREAGKNARQAMKTPHVSGRSGAARLAEDLKKQNPSGIVTRTELYLAMHSRKDGSCPTPELAEKVEKIRAIAKENPDSIHLDVDHDPVAQVYGPEKSGHSVRGLGLGVSRISLRHAAPVLHQLEQEKRLRAAAEEKVAELKEKVASIAPTRSVEQPEEEDKRSHLFSSSKPKIVIPPMKETRFYSRKKIVASKPVVEETNKIRRVEVEVTPSITKKRKVEESESECGDTETEDEDYVPDEQEGRLCVFEGQNGHRREQAESQRAAVSGVEEVRRGVLSAEEKLAILQEQVVSQKEQIGELRHEKEEMSDLKKQIISQGLMIADMKELIARLCS